MSQQQLQQARELIVQKRYNEARMILQNVNHPTAQQWLTKLNQIAPVQNTPVQSTPIQNQGTPPELNQARELIKQKRYDEAQVILRSINHPTATQWLNKLEQITAQSSPVAEVTSNQTTGDGDEEESPKVTLLQPRQPDEVIDNLLAGLSEADALKLVRETSREARYGQANRMLERITGAEADSWRASFGEKDIFQPVLIRTRDASGRSPEMVLHQGLQLMIDRKLEEATATLMPVVSPVAESWKLATTTRREDDIKVIWLDYHWFYKNPDGSIDIGARYVKRPDELARYVEAVYQGNTATSSDLLMMTPADILLEWRDYLYRGLRYELWIHDPRRAVYQKALTPLETRTQLQARRRAKTSSQSDNSPSIFGLEVTQGNRRHTDNPVMDMEIEGASVSFLWQIFKAIRSLFSG